MHSIDFREVVYTKREKKSMPFVVRSKLSSTSLKPKNLVEAHRLLKKKYQNYNPFEPDYLDSEYLD
jgi:hypothetical protein